MNKTKQPVKIKIVETTEEVRMIEKTMRDTNVYIEVQLLPQAYKVSFYTKEEK